ncbi:hypothetical protein KSS87_022926 [Heliosperma pusillum]|nr:hypothetical protein KSS87_022926 [Heliosperma pusillum]
MKRPKDLVSNNYVENQQRGKVDQLQNQSIDQSNQSIDQSNQSIDQSYQSIDQGKAWTMAPSIPSALVSMLTRLPKLKFVVVTLGEEGCIMLQRTHNENDAELEETDVDECLASLSQRKDSKVTSPMCISSSVMKLKACGIGVLTGRLLVGTAEKIPPLELVDTTGAGDAFVGSVLYALCTDMPPEIMLPFAAQVVSRIIQLSSVLYVQILQFRSLRMQKWYHCRLAAVADI